MAMKRCCCEGFRYEGDVNENGEPHGTGALFMRAMCLYRGEFVKGEMHGKGFRQFQSGASYSGMLEHGMLHGFGMWISGDGRVVKQGCFQLDLFHDACGRLVEDGVEWTGSFFKGRRHGALRRSKDGFTTFWRHGVQESDG